MTARVWSVCSFQWQSYVPTLALLVQELGYPITHVGWLYLAFVGTSILASLSLHAHLKVFSPYNLLCIGYSLRCLSGALHTLGSLLVSQATWQLLICSRIVHGYSILLFPLSVVWIGARESVEQRGATLAQRNACASHDPPPPKPNPILPSRAYA
jgi:cytochrome b subunit of formate dehydrogenase